MEAVKILIVEDQALVSENLAVKLRKRGFEVIGQIESGEGALKLIEKEAPDLILMDIYLAGELDGIQTAQKINEQHDIPFIYLTDHYDKNTVNRAKETFPANYLIKPFNEHELNVAIQLAFFNNGVNKEQGSEESSIEEQYLLNNSIFIKENSRYQKIPVENIVRVNADRAYSKIFTTDRSFTFTGSLNTISKQLTDPSFVRVHRSHLVNINKITAYEGNTIYIDDIDIPVSKPYQKKFFSRFRVVK